MSFLDKIKNLGKADQQADQDDEQHTLSPSGHMPLDSGSRPESSIISEAVPSEQQLPPEFNETGSFASTSAVSDTVIGAERAEAVKKSSARNQRALTAAVAVGLIGTAAGVAAIVVGANQTAAQVRATGQAMMQSQRMAKAVSSAIIGSPGAFTELRESVQTITSVTSSLRTGTGDIPIAPTSLQPDLEKLQPLVTRAEKSGRLVIDQEKVLTQVGTALRAINRQSSDLLESAEAAASQALQANASPAEISAVGQLVMLTQRIGKSANEFLTPEGVSPEAVFLLGKDLNAFREITQGLIAGSPSLRLPGARDAQLKERLNTLLKQYEDTRIQAAAILSNLQGLVTARDAQTAILTDSEPLRKGLDGIAQQLESSGGVKLWQLVLLLGSLTALVVGAVGFLRLYVADQKLRATMAEEQKAQAEAEQAEAKRVNDANQAAILRLMNELQAVAEGDLTQQATVTEDITGAIADSVNYTVEELRNLVTQVQGTAARVTETTGQVDQTSTELLAASTEQLHEIRATGEAVLQMAGRINEVSGQAQQTAQVARQSRQAAEQGLQAMQNNIAGMNQIRDHIQETSKRIKRLGESSQEIGEITELISDITEQTNVLALNAAIQAASAGEAGRGFSVVAEEVQRLAERSGDATRRISVLVKTIQTDTHDAVAAMERSTVGVVEGTKLSDAAGNALEEIDKVSRRLDELIAQISQQALSEAQSANEVASNIQHIFAVTEQTGEGTRSTASMVHELSRSAEALRQSVSRFKVG